MNVVETSRNGVVNELTIFSFTQTKNVVSAVYSGGQIVKGFLVGSVTENNLRFSYCQLQVDGKIDSGNSECDIFIENGKIKLVEHFQWTSRNNETGINVFQQL